MVPQPEHAKQRQGEQDTFPEVGDDEDVLQAVHNALISE
jgi:hypothetical protein